MEPGPGAQRPLPAGLLAGDFGGPELRAEHTPWRSTSTPSSIRWPPTPYGSRYVFSTLDQKEFSLQTRVNYVMSPKMSLQVYMQPLVSVGHYTGFKQFARPRTFDFIPLDSPPGSLTYDPAAKRYTAVPGRRRRAVSRSTTRTSTSSRCG